jgi:8-oxo-dGTP pyrophosphatase MutT (NUDIX family)
MKTCVGAFLFQNGLVLLGLRSSGRSLSPGAWDAIGGHVEPGESIQDALVRELAEEIQVTPIDFTELATLIEVHPNINGQASYHMFIVTRWEGDGPAMQGNEHSQIRWFAVSEAMSLSLAHPGYVELFGRLNSGRSS